MSNIHPTAIVSSKAKIGSNIIVGPYAVIEDDVEIGDDCSVGPHAVIYNGARVGNNVRISQGASVANLPQDLKFKNEKTLFIIGDNTVIREFVTLHRGTVETGKSEVGKNCLLMAYSHVPHDCSVGDNCILANAVQIGGHSHIEDYVIVGGSTAIHQFCLIGQHAMVGGALRVTQDVPPFILAADEPIKYAGINVVGLKRRGFTNEDIDILKEAYRYLYSKSLNISQAKKKIESKLGDNKLVQNIISFLEKSKRGIVGK